MIIDDYHASPICAVRSKNLTSAFVMSKAAGSASRSPPENAIMCDRLTHCTRALTPPDAPDDHQLCKTRYAPPPPSEFWRTAAWPSLPPTTANIHFVSFTISTDTASFVQHAKTCFTLPRLQAAGHRTVSPYELHQITRRAYYIVTVLR